MIEIVWEFVIAGDARGPFELAFGPGGAWSRIVSGRPGFRGTTLLHDTARSGRYLTLDLWDAERDWLQTAADCAAALSAFDADLDTWDGSRVQVGIFSLRAQGTVRPVAKSRGRAGGSSGRHR